MPILLDDITSPNNSTARTVNPHFFSSLLTGNGGSRGLLNSSRRPGRHALGQNAKTQPVEVVNTKAKTSSSSVTVRTMPFGALTTNSQVTAKLRKAPLKVPSAGDRFHVTASATVLDFDVYVDLTPQGAVLTEDGSGDAISRSLDVVYRMETYVLRAGSTSAEVPLALGSPSPATSFIPGKVRALEEFVLTRMSYAPLDDIEDLIKEASNIYSPSANGVFVDTAELATWMSEYDLYDRICRQAEMWAGNGIGEAISDHITMLFDPQAKAPNSDTLNELSDQLRYLEGYNVPLDAYRQIYSTIRTVCPTDIAEILAKQNLNLLMNGTLADLDALKPQLAVPASTPAAVASLPKKFSTQQREAITTEEPLSLTTAGAGTGKSTTILARIDYLVACGIPASNITVLSFTNAAADNILEKNPHVGSMTIARMVLDIYNLNYPAHQISTVDSIVNSLDIFFPNNDMVAVLRRRLVEVDKNQDGATTALNAFIEWHFDEVMAVLDKIQQTCLELQIIVAYQRIDQLTEPPHLAGQFLIVDEVQDNSIFEFIYLLRYVNKHRQNMFIVGDASQTLYEFRSANPKALNALEGSGVFVTHKLTTNYRSNQEILDFANVHLADIEANALSQIRLQANSLAQPTAASFKERVTLDYYFYPSQKAFTEDFPALLENNVKSYIDDCLARGENVAFLAYRKADGTIFEETLKKMYPGEQIANITSKRRRPMTVFSQYIKKYWNDVLQVPPADASFVVSRGIIDNLEYLLGRNAVAMQPVVARAVSDWWITQSSTILGWVALHKAGAMSRVDFFDSLMRNVLDYEISQNGIKQNILNQQNRDRKEQNSQGNARLTVSTIHGAKGLEFDNVVVLQPFKSSDTEENKRLYYVALTRAIRSEYVLSFGTVKKPRISTDYDLIVQALTKREQLDLLRQQGLDLDTMSDDETSEAIARLEAERDAAAKDDNKSIPEPVTA
jgi:DNA helicase-2/ATP-dependent DNA helicase PcrA